MCYARRRSETGVDESNHHALVNETLRSAFSAAVRLLDRRRAVSGHEPPVGQHPDGPPVEPAPIEGERVRVRNVYSARESGELDRNRLVEVYRKKPWRIYKEARIRIHGGR